MVRILDQVCNRPPWSPDVWLEQLEAPVSRYLVGQLAGEIVGFAGAHLAEDEGHITIVAVDPHLRGRRLGEQLLRELLRRMREEGCRRVTLEVRQGNGAAQSLYQRLGFSPISRRPRYYSDCGEDAIVMWLSLEEGAEC